MTLATHSDSSRARTINITFTPLPSPRCNPCMMLIFYRKSILTMLFCCSLTISLANWNSEDCWLDLHCASKCTVYIKYMSECNILISWCAQIFNLTNHISIRLQQRFALSLHMLICQACCNSTRMHLKCSALMLWWLAVLLLSFGAHDLDDDHSGT